MKFFQFLKIIPQLLKPIMTVQEINLDLYQGTWYQAATSRSTKLLGTGIDFKNVSAEYECINTCSNNNISVVNKGYNGKGEFTSIKGYSYCRNNSVPSKRKVVFNGVPFEGNYWIVKLGPVKDEKYDYAVISGPITSSFGTRFSLYVLCRNKKRYKEMYRKEVKNWCFNNGFKYWWNKYIETI